MLGWAYLLKISDCLVETIFMETTHTHTADRKMKLPVVANKIPVHMFIPTAVS